MYVRAGRGFWILAADLKLSATVQGAHCANVFLFPCWLCTFHDNGKLGMLLISCSAIFGYSAQVHDTRQTRPLLFMREGVATPDYAIVPVYCTFCSVGPSGLGSGLGLSRPGPSGLGLSRPGPSGLGLSRPGPSGLGLSRPGLEIRSSCNRALQVVRNVRDHFKLHMDQFAECLNQLKLLDIIQAHPVLFKSLFVYSDNKMTAGVWQSAFSTWTYYNIIKHTVSHYLYFSFQRSSNVYSLWSTVMMGTIGDQQNFRHGSIFVTFWMVVRVSLFL